MKENVKRSPLFYVGDKYKLIPEIITHFPKGIRTFVEPFVGGGSVFMNVAAEHYMLNDIDANVIALHKFLSEQANHTKAFFDNLWDVIRHYGLSCSYLSDTIPLELKAQYPKTYFAKYNKEKYIQLRTDFNKPERTDLVRLYLLLIYGFNHMLRFNSQGAFNLPVGNVDFNANVVNALKAYFKETLHKAPVWSNLDFRQFLSDLSLDKRDFVYLDPPYLITFSEYNKLWDNETERELLHTLDILSHKGIRFAISNVTHYKGRVNELFLSWSKKYHTHSIKSNYISFHDNSIKSFKEVLVTNY